MLADVPNILDDITETAIIIENADWSDIEKAVAFFENQIFSFSSTGKTFAIAKKDMTKRFGRLVAACSRLRNAVIMHRDYKDCIDYAAGKDTFILLDPPYKGTENYYQKASFGSDEHAKLFEFMNGIHEKYNGECKFIITYNNDPYIKELADKYGFDTYVKERLHNMLQSTKPGEMFEELLIGNYDLKKQPRSQDLPNIAALNFAISIVSKEKMISSMNIVGDTPYIYIIDEYEAIDIYNMIDFEIAEYLYNMRNNIQ